MRRSMQLRQSGKNPKVEFSSSPSFGDELVVDGGFADTANWTEGAGWAVAGGVATKTAGTASSVTNIGPTLAAGGWYLLNGVWTRTAGTFQQFAGGAGGPARSASGSYLDVVRGIAATAPAGSGDASFAGTLDNFSCKQLSLPTLFLNAIQAQSDVIISVNVTLSLYSRGGVFICLDSLTNPLYFITAHTNGVNVRLEECVNGTWNILQTTAITYVAGSYLKLIKSGTTLSVFYNGSQVGTNKTCTATTHKLHGIFNTHASNSFNNLSFL